MSKAPKVEPIHVQEFTVKQSKYDVCGKLPIRTVILGPSGSGKTVLLQNMILDTKTASAEFSFLVQA